jgi:hypothetical protein
MVSPLECGTKLGIQAAGDQTTESQYVQVRLFASLDRQSLLDGKMPYPQGRHEGIRKKISTAPEDYLIGMVDLDVRVELLETSREF